MSTTCQTNYCYSTQPWFITLAQSQHCSHRQAPASAPAQARRRHRRRRRQGAGIGAGSRLHLSGGGGGGGGGRGLGDQTRLSRGWRGQQVSDHVRVDAARPSVFVHAAPHGRRSSDSGGGGGICEAKVVCGCSGGWRAVDARGAARRTVGGWVGWVGGGGGRAVTGRQVKAYFGPSSGKSDRGMRTPCQGRRFAGGASRTPDLYP
jgi:hypothetical protein